MGQDRNSGQAQREGWAEIRLDVPREFEDELGGLLACEGLGVESLPSSTARSTLRVFYRDLKQASARRGPLEGILRGYGLQPGDCAVSVAPVADGRWVERYQQGLRPFELGRGFQVDPGCGAAEVSGRRTLRLIPGRAFGTGEHPTTRLCTELLERRVEPESRWVDLGCGSCILSLIADSLGAAEVLALDTDAEAVAVGREVLQANRASGKIELSEGSVCDVPGSRDGVVANIAPDFFLRHAGQLAAVLAPGGWALTSGYLSRQADEVEAALERAGLVHHGRSVRGDWAASTHRLVPGT